jgi:hypothetical protein
LRLCAGETIVFDNFELWCDSLTGKLASTPEHPCEESVTLTLAMIKLRMCLLLFPVAKYEKVYQKTDRNFLWMNVSSVGIAKEPN